MRFTVRCVVWSSIVAVLAIVLFTTLIAESILVVQNDEIALIYNNVSREFDRNQTPLQQGRYAVQTGQSFFIFKRVFVLLKLEGSDGVTCLTKDGLSLDLEVTFQYRLRQDELVTMISTLDADYQNVITLVAMAAIRDSCGNFSSVEFYYNRGAVQDDMNSRVVTRLDNIYCDGGLLQLVNVEFADDFSNAVQSTQAAIQDVTQAQNERQQLLVEAQTEVLQSLQYADITITNANAEAEVILANAEAEAMSINATLDAQLEVYQSISFTLGLSGEALINYIAIQTLSNSENQVTLAIESPAAFSFPVNNGTR